MLDIVEDVVLETEVKTKLIFDNYEEKDGTETIAKVNLNNIDVTNVLIKKPKRKKRTRFFSEIPTWFEQDFGYLPANQYRIVEGVKERGVRFYFFNGCGGSGKTESLKSLIVNLGFDTKTDSNVLVPTGKAADVAADRGFDAVTFHSASQWQVSKNRNEFDELMVKIHGSNFQDLIDDPNSEYSKKMIDNFRGKKFICVDEISMITDEQFEVILSLVDTFMDSDAIALFSGDFMQLPPPGETLYPCGSMIVDLKKSGELEIINFEKRFRSLQPEMNDFCVNLRNGVYLDKAEFYEACEYLKTIKVLPKLNKNNLAQFTDFTYITYTRDERDRVNDLYLEYFPGFEYLIKEIQVSFKGPDQVVLCKIRGNMTCLPFLKFKIGMHIMFSTNDSLGRFVNGEHGTIKGVTLDSDGEIDTIDVEKFCRVRNNTVIINVERKDYKADVLKQDEGYDVHFKQFPLELAHAMTIHKAQGSGYKKLIIDLSSIDSLPEHKSMLRFRLFYTAITRTIDTDYLYFHGIGSDFFDCKNRKKLYSRYICKPDYDLLTFKFGINLPHITPIRIDF